MTKFLFYSILALTLTLGACASRAPKTTENGTALVGSSPHQEPPALQSALPQEQIQACENKKVGEKCFYQIPRKDIIRGVCEKNLSLSGQPVGCFARRN